MGIQLNKRNNLTPSMLPFEGKIFTLVGIRESESGFYAYDLRLIDEDRKEVVIGLQRQSFNVDSLITIFGTDNTDEWMLKQIKCVPSKWNSTDVIRFERVEPSASGKSAKPRG